MNYPTIATYQNTDWNNHVSAVGQHLTSFIREGGTDNECPVKYACPNDGNKFINCLGENDKRVIWVFCVIRCQFEIDRERRSDGPDGNVGEALVELLEGKEEDIWLWVDGDEDDLPEPPHIRHLSQFEHYAAVQALQRRQAIPRWESRRHAEMRGRVQSKSLPECLAAIAWLAISSKALKKLDHTHGRSDRVKWNLGESIEEWYSRYFK